MNSNHNLTSHRDLGERTKAVSAIQLPSLNNNPTSPKLPKLFGNKRGEQAPASSEKTRAFSTVYSTMDMPDDFPQQDNQGNEPPRSSNKNSPFGKSSATNQNFEKTRALDISQFAEVAEASPSPLEIAAQEAGYQSTTQKPHAPHLDTDTTAAIKVPKNLKLPPPRLPGSSGNMNSNDKTESNDAIVTVSNHDVNDIERMINKDLDIDISTTSSMPVPSTDSSEETASTVSFSPIEDNFSEIPPDLPASSDDSLNFKELHFVEKEENRWQNAQQYQLPSIGDTIDHYTIINELGRGSFGAVYKAKNLTLGREEALKLILPSAKTELEDIEKRFEREINIVSRLEHPNIVRLYSSGKLPQGILWMTMELVQGERVDQRLMSKGPFKYADARNFMLQLLSGLREAHKRQIVHRDLKPANIMLQQKEGYPDQVVILDFGLSKGIGPADNNELQNLTQMSSQKVFGTPQYMAPEQLRMGSVGPWTDVYAAGLIFYELIVGKRAIDAKTLFEVAYKQYHEEIKLPQYLHNTAIEGIIQKACAKNPSHRYKNASEFYDAVKKLGDIYSPNDNTGSAENANNANIQNARGPQKNLETVVYSSSPLGSFNNAQNTNGAGMPSPAMGEDGMNQQLASKRSLARLIIFLLILVCIALVVLLVVLLIL
ncbi:MAG: serine/threonine protein kinase [Proteobacteria bacterium]|nr:serine/threonine protein kinase [Pseudomonadota bacterium]